MTASQLLAASVFVALALPAAGADSQAHTRRTPFTHFGADAAIELRDDGATSTIDFGNRVDELVTRARLHLVYSYSPALAPGASLIRVAVNDEEIGTLPVTAAQAGQPVARVIEIDPRLIVGSNRLKLTLAATPGAASAEGERPGLWAEVSGASELEVAYQVLAMADDLSALPEPFFDRRDQRRVTIPFAFNAHPSKATLTAAAVAASWFGKLAQWRGTRFPAALEIAPEGHALAFAANNERPAFLASLPPATGPELRMMTNPGDGRSRLLVVLGRDGNDLRAAVEALVAGAKLTGAAMKVQPAPATPARMAYDAPSLVPGGRPVKFSELVGWPKQLETTGRPPELPRVKLDLRVPPDLATWRSAGVPLVLQVRYTPNACIAETQLEVLLDDEPLYVAPLATGGAPVAERHEAFIPPYRVRGRMELEFVFRLAVADSARCREAPAPVAASIAPESTIDLSGFPHVGRMPNLDHFVTAGYPFTKYADLSQTVVVMPDRITVADVEAMLGLMGRMGEATAHPATRVRVAAAGDEALLADADLLVVGATPQQSLLVRWANELPVSLAGYSQRTRPPQVDRVAGVRQWLGMPQQVKEPPPAPVSFEGGAPVAAMFGFESPVSSGRSVVAVTAVSPHQVLRVLEALEDRDQRRAVRGNAAFVFPGKVESVFVGPTYTVGFMPPWTGAGYWLQRHPNVVAALVFAGCGLLAWGAFAVKRRLDARRAEASA